MIFFMINSLVLYDFAPAATRGQALPGHGRGRFVLKGNVSNQRPLLGRFLLWFLF